MEKSTFKLIVAKSKKDKNRLSIELEGDLSLKNSKEIKNKILAAVENYENLNIKINQVKNLDISLIQILTAIKKEKKEVTFLFDMPEHTKSLLLKAGFEKLITNN